MNRNALRLADYLTHILEAIDRIERYTRGLDRAAFMSTDMVQDAVIRNFEIIGEASRNITKRHRDFAAANPNLPLAVAYEMRNAVAHGYFKVDLGIVWKTVRDDLDALKRSVASALIEVCTNHGLAGADHDE